MVQSAREPFRGGNKYWKLIDGSYLKCLDLKIRLNAKGYIFPRNVRKLNLIKMYRQATRGFVQFHGCPKEQLTQFCNQRGLSVTAVNPKKVHLIEVLEAADEQRTFHRFPDLPPELRAYIFELHFSSFGVLEAPGRPPVTQVSRQFRQEALPLFYKTCTFAVKVNRGRRWVKCRNGDMNLQRVESLGTYDFVNHTANMYLDMIRKVSLEGDIFHPAGPIITRDRTWLIDFAATSVRMVTKGRQNDSSLIEGVEQERVAKTLLQKVEETNMSSINRKSKVGTLLAVLKDAEIDLTS